MIKKHQRQALATLIAFGTTLTVLSGLVHAELDLSTTRGQETVSHTAPNSTAEVAIRPAGFPGHPEIYSKKDIEKEKELAGIDFYNGKTQEGLDIVPIPKTYSTSPGINIHAVKLPDGTSRLDYAAAHAKKAQPSGDKVIAKFKQSIPTHFTYSPSILGYYHLSRFLDTGHVEPAIVRTMDVSAHKSLANIGKANASGSNNQKQWTELRALDEVHGNPILYTKDGKQLFGSLQVNPGGEESYPHLSQLAGAGAFEASAEFRNVTAANSLMLSYKDVGGNLIQAAVQKIAQVKDLSDMVLMDFIMSQADRFSGNMHSRKTYVWIENGVLKDQAKKSDPVKAAEQARGIPPGAILINRMIMKDNDAGLISGNLAKSNHLLEKVGHMDPKTYNRLLGLQTELQKPEVAQWYQSELLFSAADFKTMKDNVNQAVNILSARKDKGLVLDASLSLAMGSEMKAEPEPEKPAAPDAGDNAPLPVIASSVGRWEKGAQNLSPDVKTVQRLLKAASDKLQAPKLDPKGADGKIAYPPATSNTASAIEAFQSLCSISVDGLIQPDSQAWKALLKAAGMMAK